MGIRELHSRRPRRNGRWDWRSRRSRRHNHPRAVRQRIINWCKRMARRSGDGGGGGGATYRDRRRIAPCTPIPSHPKLGIHPFLGDRQQPPFVPLWAPTRLPPRATDVTEFGSASARHVEAAEVEFNHLGTAWAAGPARGVAEREDLGGVCVGTTDMRPITAVLLATLATRSPCTARCRTGIHFTGENAFRDGSQEPAACRS